MANRRGTILWMKVLGASFGATGFILLGVGGIYNNIIAGGLIGVGSAFIAGGS